MGWQCFFQWQTSWQLLGQIFAFQHWVMARERCSCCWTWSSSDCSFEYWCEWISCCLTTNRSHLGYPCNRLLSWHENRGRPYYWMTRIYHGVIGRSFAFVYFSYGSKGIGEFPSQVLALTSDHQLSQSLFVEWSQHLTSWQPGKPLVLGRWQYVRT